MKTHHVTIMPGDGIGPEVMNATIKVLKATGVPFYFDFQPIGASTPDGLPDTALASMRRTRVGT
jgi:isocitrate dehydrogenase (NAD+)